MANKLLHLPGNRLFNNSNIAAPGGTATLYLSGTSTLANFLDSSAVSLGPTITANGLGQLPDAYGDETIAYRVILKDSSGVELDGGDIDPFYFGRDNSLITTASGSAVATRTLLSAISGPTAKQAAILTEAKREGNFVFDDSDLSAKVTADTAQGIYVPPASDATGASGAWVRKFNGAVPAKSFGVVGDGTTDDSAALNAALAFAATNGNGVVQLEHDSTVLIGASVIAFPEGAYLDGNKSTLLCDDLNQNFITLTRSSGISNCTIDASGLTTFTNALILSNSSTTGPMLGATWFIRNVRILGIDPGVAAPTGTAIKLAVAGTSNHRISFCEITGCYIEYFENGVWADCAVPASGVNWTTSCRVDGGTTFFDVVNAVKGTAPSTNSTIGAWVFDYVTQPDSAKATFARSLLWDGELSFGQIMCWDMSAAGSTDNKGVEFTTVSSRNSIFVSGLTDDQIINNSVTSFQNEVRTFGSTHGSTNSRATAPLVYSLPTPSGNQDDYLAYAGTRSGWTLTASTAVSTGAVNNMFDPDPDSFARWASFSGTLTLKLDLGASVTRFHALGIAFDPGDQSDELDIAISTDDVDYTTLYDKTASGSVSPAETYHSRTPQTARYIRWTLTNATAKDLIIYRLWGSVASSRGNAFVERYQGNVENQLKIDGTKVLGPRSTGWTADTGTADKGSKATYTAGATLTFTNPPTAGEMSALATRLAAVEAALQNVSRAMKAVKDAGIGHGFIGA